MTIKIEKAERPCRCFVTGEVIPAGKLCVKLVTELTEPKTVKSISVAGVRELQKRLRDAGAATCRYRYTSEDWPLRKCPKCRNDLTRIASVQVELALDGRTVTTPSVLDEEGYLTDTPDGAIASGLHSSTTCSKCGLDLVIYEDVET